MLAEDFSLTLEALGLARPSPAHLSNIRCYPFLFGYCCMYYVRMASSSYLWRKG